MGPLVGRWSAAVMCIAVVCGVYAAALALGDGENGIGTESERGHGRELGQLSRLGTAGGADPTSLAGHPVVHVHDVIIVMVVRVPPASVTKRCRGRRVGESRVHAVAGHVLVCHGAGIRAAAPPSSSSPSPLEERREDRLGAAHRRVVAGVMLRLAEVQLLVEVFFQVENRFL